MVLAGLPVGRMAAAPAAVLAELDAVGGVALRLHGLVVAPLALGAGERDVNSDSAFCHGAGTLRLSERCWGGPGHADAPPWGRGIVAGPAPNRLPRGPRPDEGRSRPTRRS